MSVGEGVSGVDFRPQPLAATGKVKAVRRPANLSNGPQAAATEQKGDR